MRKTNILPFYFPTTVCFLDDDLMFLNCIKPCLEAGLADYQLFNTSTALLHFYHESNQKKLLQFDIRASEQDEFNSTHVHLNLNAHLHEIQKTEKNKRISVIVVDQRMPGITGEEFCRRFPAPEIKKIMLTAEEDYGTAVKLINAGTIDQFIQKNEDNFFSALNQSIEFLQKSFFEESLRPLTAAVHQTPACFYLRTPAFQVFFNNFCSKNQVIEYYMLDLKGTFLCFNEIRKAFLLIVRESAEIDAFYAIAKCSNKADRPRESVMKDLKYKRKILYCGPDSRNLNTKPKDWEQQQLLYDASRIEGLKEDYYYAVADNVDVQAFIKD